jgi:hypothetical protein
MRRRGPLRKRGKLQIGIVLKYQADSRSSAQIMRGVCG